MLICSEQMVRCLAQVAVREPRKVSRDSLSASQGAGIQGMSTNRVKPTPSLSQRARDKHEPVRSFTGSPHSELTSSNHNLSEPRALPRWEPTKKTMTSVALGQPQTCGVESPQQGVVSRCEAVRKPQTSQWDDDCQRWRVIFAIKQCVTSAKIWTLTFLLKR